MPLDFPIDPLDTRDTDKQESRRNIDFYASHLGINELRIIEELSKQLARTYSESYREWVSK